MIASVTALLPRASITVWPLNTGTPSARSAAAELAGLGAQVGDGDDLDADVAQRRGARRSPRSEVVAMTARLPGLTP